MSGKKQLDVAADTASSASVSPRLTTASASPAPPGEGKGNGKNDNDITNRRRRRWKKRGDPPTAATPGGERDSSVSSRSRSIGSQSQLSKVSKGR